jgi:hypothetical protein
MKATLFAAITCLVTVTTVRAAEEPNNAVAPKAITVDAAAQARFGVSVVSLAVAVGPSGTTTTARVLDPSTLLRLDSDLAAASSSFTASRDQIVRTKKAYSEDKTASYRDVQAANAQAQVALQKVNEARRQLAMGWGGGVADLQAHSRAELLSDISASKVELARVEVPAGLAIPKAGAALTVRGLSERDTFAGSVMGLLPSVDAQSQTRAVLVRLKGDAAKLPVGQTLVADIPTPGSSGVLGVILPHAAILRSESRIWAYVQTGADTFVRKEVREYRPVSNGWFVQKGFAPGDHVVAAGAAALLGVDSPGAAETN